jgi:ABC-type antimicrobial peptide transport system ATPase subunit
MNRKTTPINITSAVIQQALQEDSNRAMDWLWYAEHITNASEKRYCLERALHIDPKNIQAAQQIKLLDAQQKRSNRKQTNAFMNPIGRLVYGLMHRA